MSDYDAEPWCPEPVDNEPRLTSAELWTLDIITDRGDTLERVVFARTEAEAVAQIGMAQQPGERFTGITRGGQLP